MAKRSVLGVRAMFDRAIDAAGLPASFKAHSNMSVRADQQNPFQVLVQFLDNAPGHALALHMPPMVVAHDRTTISKAIKDVIEPRARAAFLPVDKDAALMDVFVCFGYWSDARLKFVLGHELAHYVNGDFFAPPAAATPAPPEGMLASIFSFGREKPIDPVVSQNHEQEYAADAYSIRLAYPPCKHATLATAAHAATGPAKFKPAQSKTAPKSTTKLAPAPTAPAVAAAVPAGLSAAPAAPAAAPDVAVVLGGVEHLLKMALMHDTVSARLRASGLTAMAESSEAERTRSHPPDALRLARLFDYAEQTFGLSRAEIIARVRGQAVAPTVPDMLSDTIARLGV